MHAVLFLLFLSINPADDATQIYERAMTFARSENWNEAKAALLAGYRQHPHDKRFPLELAGISYRRENLQASAAYLKEALAIDPSDSYAIHFLGTIHFLQGNLEAALQYWNRIDKPRIVAVHLTPVPNIDATLTDRALAISPASVLHLRDLRKSRRALEMIDSFRRIQFRLVALADEEFELHVVLPQRASFGDGKPQSAVSILRGLPYETLHLDFFNLKQSGWNSRSFFRWDDDKKRAYTSLSGPLKKDPSLKSKIEFILADENWDVSRSSALFPAFTLQKQEVSAGIEKIVDDHWSWNAGVRLSHRNSRNDSTGLVSEGFSLAVEPGFKNRFFENPETGWSAEFALQGKLARFFSHDRSLYSKLHGGILTEWDNGNYSARMKLRTGIAAGALPIDDYFALGIDRDSNLWLRGHQLNDQKGTIPIGRKFALFNSEADKIVYKHSFFTAAIGPFLDTGRTWDFSPEGWQVDTGLQTQWRTVFGYTLTVSYGRQLQTGRSALFFSVSN